jgi:aspartokinase
MAAAIKADLCQIYTDVDGVYTCDPRVVKTPQKIPEISYDEMLEMASLRLQGDAEPQRRVCEQIWCAL